ncbi:hypothetical protein JW887_06675 [Candidatus Dojkabacteria bacterium]|nr:hypothetical protein [Candidatus Dojkabacteria bacterium]
MTQDFDTAYKLPETIKAPTGETISALTTEIMIGIMDKSGIIPEGIHNQDDLDQAMRLFIRNQKRNAAVQRLLDDTEQKSKLCRDNSRTLIGLSRMYQNQSSAIETQPSKKTDQTNIQEDTSIYNINLSESLRVIDLGIEHSNIARGFLNSFNALVKFSKGQSRFDNIPKSNLAYQSELGKIEELAHAAQVNMLIFFKSLHENYGISEVDIYKLFYTIFEENGLRKMIYSFSPNLVNIDRGILAALEGYFVTKKDERWSNQNLYEVAFGSLDEDRQGRDIVVYRKDNAGKRVEVVASMQVKGEHFKGGQQIYGRRQNNSIYDLSDTTARYKLYEQIRQGNHKGDVSTMNALVDDLQRDLSFAAWYIVPTDIYTVIDNATGKQLYRDRERAREMALSDLLGMHEIASQVLINEGEFTVASAHRFIAEFYDVCIKDPFYFDDPITAQPDMEEFAPDPEQEIRPQRRKYISDRRNKLEAEVKAKIVAPSLTRSEQLGYVEFDTWIQEQAGKKQDPKVLVASVSSRTFINALAKKYPKLEMTVMESLLFGKHPRTIVPKNIEFTDQDFLGLPHVGDEADLILCFNTMKAFPVIARFLNYKLRGSVKASSILGESIIQVFHQQILDSLALKLAPGGQLLIYEDDASLVDLIPGSRFASRKGKENIPADSIADAYYESILGLSRPLEALGIKAEMRTSPDEHKYILVSREDKPDQI